MHSDNVQNWILWRDKLFCDFLLFFTTWIALNANSLTFPWLFPIFIFSLTFNKIPWLFPDFCQVWNFPDRWTPCVSVYMLIAWHKWDIHCVSSYVSGTKLQTCACQPWLTWQLSGYLTTNSGNVPRDKHHEALLQKNSWSIAYSLLWKGWE